MAEGMADLVWMMNQLLDEDGNILVEGLMDRSERSKDINKISPSQKVLSIVYEC